MDSLKKQLEFRLAECQRVYIEYSRLKMQHEDIAGDLFAGYLSCQHNEIEHIKSLLKQLEEKELVDTQPKDAKVKSKAGKSKKSKSSKGKKK